MLALDLPKNQQLKIIFVQVNRTLTSQTINEALRVLQNLLKCFTGTISSTSFIPLSPVCPVIFIFSLNLNKILLLLSAGKK